MTAKYLRRIERYLNGGMEFEERSAFEAELQKNTDLKKAFDEHLEVYDALQDRDAIDLRLQLKDIHREYMSGKKGRIYPLRNKNLIWLAAIVVISLGIISLVIFYSLQGSVNRNIKLSVNREQMIATKLYQLPHIYDEMLKYRFRSEELNLKTPEDSAIFMRRQDMVFTWELHSSFPVYLDIINRNGDLVYESLKPVTSPHIVYKNLSRGVYIYRFHSSSIALTYGIFYVI